MYYSGPYIELHIFCLDRAIFQLGYSDVLAPSYLLMAIPGDTCACSEKRIAVAESMIAGFR